jgi:hypothetical protein
MRERERERERERGREGGRESNAAMDFPRTILKIYQQILYTMFTSNLLLDFTYFSIFSA